MLVVFLAIGFAVAGFGAFVSAAGVDGWYARVHHVAWTPPGWAFGAVWTVLYVLIAVAGWLLWRRHGLVPVRAPLTLYVVQLVLNALWAPVFFAGYPMIGVPALWGGLAIIVLLDLTVAATIAAAWPVSRAAALLLVPYLAWILYASTLNWGDAVLLSLG